MRSSNKTVAIMLLFCFCFSFVYVPPVQAATVTQNQIDVGYFTCWLHSDGSTWQSIPGYGVKKPGDSVTFTYTVTYDGPASDKVVGVKGASFYTGDQSIYNTTYRKEWQPYSQYDSLYGDYVVTNMTNVRAIYKGNRQVQITVTVDLKTAQMHGGPPARWGEPIKEPWQAKLTDGRKFYTPVLIEWEIEGQGPDFYPTPQGQSTYQESYKTLAATVSGRPGQTVNIPATLWLKGSGSSTKVEATWYGSGWNNPVFSRDYTVSANGSTSLSIPVPVPKQGEENRLVIMCNRTGTNPSNEVNKNNNMMVVKTTPDGVVDKQEYLTVVPCTYTLFVGDSKKFKAYHHKSDGSSTEVTNSADWSVSNSSIAKLSQTIKGDLTGYSEGAVILKAQYKGLEGTADVTVISEPAPPPPNFKPKADFDISNSSPIEGEQVHFYDSSTHEGNRYGEEIVSWEWTFEEIGSSYEQNPEATWNEVGTYKVTLRVEDQDGDSDSCTKSVVVGPAIPAAVITTSTDYVIIGREIHIDGDESTAAMGRDIKWDEMEWEFYNPNNSLAYEYTGRYPLGKGTDREKDLTNSVLNKTGNWRITLKVKDTNDNESEITEKIIQVLPDNPPIADFWLAEEGIRNSYEGYEITVRDLSTPDNPDGSLGDEIYERTWTLYYDTNNDGNAKGSGDEIIHPGDKNKAAQIIQTSNNDPRPVIRFNKTGRYQLELKVKERYDAWGETIEGLTADTEDKALEEKQIMVINLAPTVAFDIKKKTPVDILFAADYTVSDAKYNSLESGQPAFINELESGFIEPEVGVTRVKQGEVGQLWSTSLGGKTYTADEHIIGDWYRIADRSIWGQVSYKAINISTGQIQEDFGIIATLNDGTYIRAIYDRIYERVDSNLNILTPAATYEAAIKAAMPPTQTTYDWNYGRNVTTSYKLKEPIFLPNGNVFLWIIGEITIEGYSAPSQENHKLIKLNSSLVKTNTYDIINLPISSSWQQTLEISHIFKDYNQIVFKHTAPGPRSYYKYTLISAGDYGVKKNLGEWIISGASSRPPFPEFGSTGNGKFFVVGAYGNLSVYSANGLVASKAVPKGNVSGEGITMHTGKCTGILPWNDQHTAVVYQTIQDVSGQLKDDTYLYLINNTTGAIQTEKQFYDILYPPDNIGTIGYVGEWGIYSFNIVPTVLNSNLIGLDVYHYASPKSSETTLHYFSVINKNLEITYTSPLLKDGYPMTTFYRGEWKPLTANFAALHETEYYRPSGSATEKAYNQVRVFGPSGNVVLSLPRREYGTADIGVYRGRIGALDNGAFYSTDNSAVQMYSSAGSLLWQKPFAGISSSSSFMDLVVATPINLVNPANGTVVNTIPGNYFVNNNKQLVTVDGGILTGYGQLSGLQYLKQAIEGRPWDNNKLNIIASVIDANGFVDFEAQKNNIQSLLKSKNLKLAVISPSTGSTRAQAEHFINLNPDGGWWILTDGNMATPLSNLAKKIIAAVEEDKGADNIVLVGHEATLKANYADEETDPASQMVWSFTHDRFNLGNLPLVNAASISVLHNTSRTVSLDTDNQNRIDIVFDRAGTYKVYCKAQDIPNTTDAYFSHEKAGKKWSNQDAYLTVIAHHKPIANFTINSNSIYKNGTLSITDNSYDPDLYNPSTKTTTDPQGLKGIRVWEWQYKTPAGTWDKHITNDNTPPNIYASSGTYAVRLRVQDNFGAWSDWSESKIFNVINRPPVADFSVNPNPAAVANRSMIIDSSYDPDGDQIVEWEWEIEKGLGETETIIRTSAAPFPYVWNTPGTFNVKLTVKDSEGATGTTTKMVTVILNNPPIAIIKLPDEIYTDEWFTADGTESYDPDGDTLVRAYWQYKKPNDTDWTNVYIQELSGPFIIPGESFLKYPLFPLDGEHGTWWLRLIVEDNKGLLSLPAEISFTVQEGFEVSGYVIPNPGERGRDMIIFAYAHRKDNIDDKLEITNMKAYIIHPFKPDGSPSMASGHSPEAVNMVFDEVSKEYKYTFRVPEIIEKNRWPDDGSYYIRVVGTKGSTEKDALLPANIKGHIQQRLYIKTRSW